MKNKDKIKDAMIDLAMEMYHDIVPPGNRPTLNDAFTLDKKGELILWFNTKDKSAHIIREDMVDKK